MYKKMVFLLVFGTALVAGVLIFTGCSKKDAAHAGRGQEIIYTCPMHPSYLSHKPGSCPICGMNLVPATGADAPATGEKKIAYYRDALNPSYTSNAPGKAPDGMDLVPVYEEDEKGKGVKIDPAMIQSIGVKTQKAAIRTLTRDIRSSATVMPDERRIVSITTKVMGYVEKLYVNSTGQRIQKGQVLYDLYSPELVSAQNEYLQALGSAASIGTRDMIESARQRLLNWDFTPAQIESLQTRGTPLRAMPVVSPASGIVSEKMVVEGQSVEPGMRLYTVIDYSKVWVEGALYQQDIPLVKVGQQAQVVFDFYPGESFLGVVTYIAPELNMESRTLMVRVELANTPDLKVKPGMNASSIIHAGMSKNMVTVPDEAVIHSGLRTLVVIARGGGYFEPREVLIGQTAGGYTQVLSGVNVGDDIVVSSQFLIDSESNLKAAVSQMSAGPVPAGAGAVPVAPGVDTATTMDHIKFNAKSPAHGVPQGTAQARYICPMKSDSDVVSDTPGECPKCGMDLVKKE